MSKMINLTIDNQQVQAPEGSTILEAAGTAGLKIPTLCYLRETKAIGSCRICVVEVEGARNLIPSCMVAAKEGMRVKTNTTRVREARKTILNLILSDHPMECLTCSRNQRCELQKLTAEMGITEAEYDYCPKVRPQDSGNPAIVRDSNKCILCRRCVSVCHEVQGVKAIGPLYRGSDTIISPAFALPLGEVSCVFCGQCTVVCPTGALSERSSIEKVWRAINDQNKHAIVQVAPAVRIALGEEFGMPSGAIVTGKVVAALKRLGFDKVFDTDFSADLTIMEEGSEFLERLKKKERLPLITSCSPGWIKYIEHFYPDMIPNLSTCKSPQQMFGAIMKTYYANTQNIDSGNIYTVSVMPCTAKKFEADRPEMRSSGHRDVDAVLTTRELAKMIREAGIDWESLPVEAFDNPFGEGSGAGVIFGASGGVMEAALRTVYEIVTGESLSKIDFEAVRGLEGIKEATVQIGDLQVKVAVTNGLSNAKKILDLVKSGQKEYHFIEIMACPGGCLGGGGQPRPNTQEIRKQRMQAVYQADRGLAVRKSHENEYVQRLYQSFLNKPLGEKSHKLLHTHYRVRNK